MPISKTTAASLLIGTTSATAVTTVAIKNSYSKSEQIDEGKGDTVEEPGKIEEEGEASDLRPEEKKENSLEETKNQTDDTPAANSEEVIKEKTNLQKVQEEILSWAKEHGDCVVRIKHENKPVEVNSFSNEEDLKSLLSAFKGSNKNNFENHCKPRLETRGGTDKKPELDVEKTNSGGWDFYEPDEEQTENQ